jgi:hypothetical protein
MTDDSPAGDGVGAGANPDAEMQRRALKAFRKRLKLTRLDDESRLGNRYVTGGRHSAIMAILPPREYPPAVWAALVAQGKLRDAGNGFYELLEPGATAKDA